MTRRAAIYARYSSALQDPTSITDQIDMATRLCSGRGWHVVSTFTDEEQTGRNMSRQGFLDLMAAAAGREFDVVVVEAVDRLSRRLTHALTQFEVMAFHGVGLVSVAEGEQDFFRFMLHSLGAQHFSEAIGKHTRRGMQGALCREQRTHSRAYGYRRVASETGPNREPDPETAPVVLRIFRELAAGKSAGAIAADLNREGIPGPNGGTWDGSTIRGNAARKEGIARNTMYVGLLSTCKTGRTYHPVTGQKAVLETPSEAVEVEVPSLRIVPQELWEAAQAQLARRSTEQKAAGNPRAAVRKSYLLSGILECACCGAPYVIVGRDRYGCREARKHACANRVTISREGIERRVFDRLRGGFLSDALAERFDQALRAEVQRLTNVDPANDAAATRRMLSSLEREVKNIMKAIGEGAPYAMFKARVDELEEAMATTRSALDAAEAAASAPLALPKDTRSMYAAAVARIEGLLLDPDTVDQANSALAELLRRVVLTPDPAAAEGLAAEIHTDLGSLLSGAGYGTFSARVSGLRQLTVRQRALPPSPRPRRLPRSICHQDDGRDGARDGRPGRAGGGAAGGGMWHGRRPFALTVLFPSQAAARRTGAPAARIFSCRPHGISTTACSRSASRASPRPPRWPRRS